MSKVEQVSEVSAQHLKAGELVPIGYKRTEVGVIPEDWVIRRLSEVTNIIGDGIHATPEYSSAGEYYFVNGNNIENGDLRFDENTKQVDEKEFSKYKSNLSSSSLLLSINGTIGNLALYNDEPVLLGKSAAFLNIKNQYERQYIYFSLQMKSVADFFNEGLTGTTIKNLGLTTIRATPIAVPIRLEEQTAIANALSDVDELLNSLEKLIAKKHAIKTATMQQLLNGKTRLPAFAFREDGTRKGYKDSELGEIPEDLGVVELSKLITFHNAGVYKAKSLYGNGTNIVGVGDIYDISKIDGRVFRKVPLTEDEKRRFLLEEGDLIYGESSLVREGIARTVYVDDAGAGTAFAWHTRRYQVNKEKVNSEYLYYYLAGNMARSHMISNSITTALTGINTVAYFACPIFLPSQEEQIAIATILSDMDTEIQTLEKRLSKTRQIKQGMMQELLTGKTRLVKPIQEECEYG